MSTSPININRSKATTIPKRNELNSQKSQNSLSNLFTELGSSLDFFSSSKSSSFSKSASIKSYSSSWTKNIMELFKPISLPKWETSFPEFFKELKVRKNNKKQIDKEVSKLKSKGELLLQNLNMKNISDLIKNISDLEKAHPVLIQKIENLTWNLPSDQRYMSRKKYWEDQKKPERDRLNLEKARLEQELNIKKGILTHLESLKSTIRELEEPLEKHYQEKLAEFDFDSSHKQKEKVLEQIKESEVSMLNKVNLSD